ncbi:MAG TPA: hypothetical protein VF516_23550 [Kofleriaceae bacterium]
MAAVRGPARRAPAAEHGGPSQFRIARLEPWTIPMIYWSAGAVVLVAWGWSLWSVLEALFSG